MSNLVLQADRRFGSGPRRGDEATGEAESLAGRVSVKDMGTRLTRDAAPKEKKAPKKSELGGINGDGGVEDVRVPMRGDRRRKEAGLSEATDFAVEDLKYRPRTQETRDVFDLILAFVLEQLGDVPSEVVRSAADAVLETLKMEGVKDFDKKQEIEDTLGSVLKGDRFNKLVNLGKKITDYNAEGDQEMGGTDEQGENADLDDRHGVAVVFEEEEEDDEDGPRQYAVDDDTSEDEQDALAGPKSDNEEKDEDADGESGDELIIKAATTSSNGKKSKAEADKDLVPAHSIDAFWLQRTIGTVYSDVHEAATKTTTAMDILASEAPLRQVENDLMELFDYEHFEVVKILTKNRDKIVWCTRLAKAGDEDEAKAVKAEMLQNGLRGILDEVEARDGKSTATATGSSGKIAIKADLMDVDVPAAPQAEKKAGQFVTGLQPKKTFDLESLIFEQGNHLMTNPNVRLPQGSTKRLFKGYEEYHIPVPKKKADVAGEELVNVSSMPEWAQHPFTISKSTKLNRIQSKCYPTAFKEDGNMLVCAPTGSGKTNVAMLTMLREIGKNIDPKTGQVRLDDFKIIYIAPLKALVQEQVGNFGKRLEHYGLKVAELTGDRQLTKAQIADTQVIVTTPEKWDVITRKATDTSYTNLVRLIIIDEIHLLHDDRGPVLESIVSRCIRKQEQTLEPVRIVGLSATLPNYLDVAAFLRVDTVSGLFHFDSSYRPCPLKQEFVGVTEKKPHKQLQVMNEVTYNKVMEQVTKNQMLIFVHSRADTGKTGKYIRDKAIELGTIGDIIRSDEASQEILREEAAGVENAELKDLMPYGIGIHHAGMRRIDRQTVEDLFTEGSIRVLVCTATLAWGVNLPAHTVIIKGTTVYSPEKGDWVELSPQDVLQMLGRAGRPQYDSYGEGIIITKSTELQYYLGLLNQQLPIESQFVSKLIDNLNAEVVLGTIRNRDDAVEWLGYTYLYVRMLRSPNIYNVGADYADDEVLLQKRVDLVHSAAVALEKCHLIKYDVKSGRLQSTELGRIASHYYITHKSMLTYNQHLQPNISPIELFRLFSLSEEFKYIPVRRDEAPELQKLLAKVPIPVKETAEDPQAKINVLLQAYISRLKLDGLALMADMVYVTQSAGRILRAVFEMSLKKGWAGVTKTALELCKTVEKRMWPTMTPLRQFPDCPADVIRKMEKMDIPWSRMFDMEVPELGELVGNSRNGRLIHEYLRKFPKVGVQAQVQPVTRSMLRVEMTITPEFVWDESVHGGAEGFWIIAEDCDGENILFSDNFILKKQYTTGEENQHLVEFTVPISEPLPPNYFFTVISDRWMHSEARLAVSFRKLILPEKFPPHTQLLDLQPLPVNALKRKEFVSLYPEWKHFNKIQTQVFNSLFSTDDNVFVGAPTGSGKTVCAEFALLRHWSKKEPGRAVYIAPFQELIDQRLKDWQKRLAHLGKTIVKLTGETTADLKLLEKGDLILATPGQWDVLSRQWQRRKNVQTVNLFIADDIHMLGGTQGYLYEIVVSRMQYIAIQLEKSDTRIIALSVSLSNARDLGEWIGATSHTIYNFSPLDRPIPLEIHMQSFTIPHHPSLILAMIKPVYQAIVQHAGSERAIVYVSSRKECRSSSMDLLTQCIAADDEDIFLHADPEDEGFLKMLEKVQEKALAASLRHGIGYYNEALSNSDKQIVSYLFEAGAIQVLFATRDVCWELDMTAPLVVVMGTQFFEGREHRYIDYPLNEVLQMFGKSTNKAVLMTPAAKKDYYRKFVNEALPIESHLQSYLSDAFVAEISTKMITSTQDAVDWTTYTYFYRRLLANPSFYGLADVSHEGLSAFLSELVENTLKELSEAKTIDLDEGDDSITPLNPAMIAAYYNVSFITMQTFLLSLNAKTKLKGLLEIVTSATEFETLQIRKREEVLLRRIHESLPVRMSEPINYESTHFKAFVLMQAHFSRLQLPADLKSDQAVLLGRALNLLNACVDVLSSEGCVNAMRAMEMSQMVVQAMWDVSRDSPLKQIPYFTGDAIKIAASFGIKRVFDFIDEIGPDGEQRDELLKALNFDRGQLQAIASFTNDKHPDVEFNAELEDEDNITAGAPAYVNITLSRDEDSEDDEEPDLMVHAPFYPLQKMEGWWVVVTDDTTNSLLAIKRLTFGKSHRLRLEYVVLSPGTHKISVFLMSDSYVDVDQELNFEVTVAEGMDEDEEEEDEDEEDEE
ncbi:pre-mRNA-splicing factor brr2 [Drechslerella stenobrocha 248]|uniref:Pre-mRNA-splicing factor brr2 n=1 Tax=Drechslerella stenobrocha 248 TaxID=1043628 RepID=W7I6Y1_9PEZI|nr:pre-mRNA-splicing factor brr2 [Drechslerella stenobrocha 248]